jgi:excisionase family DNA binding protein
MLRKDFHLLTAKEAAQILGQHPSTIRRKARSGELPSLKIGLGERAPSASTRASSRRSFTTREEPLLEYFDPEKLLADARARKKAADERIDRDTASIYKIMAIWRRIGKTTPSPITLPSGRRIVPKRSASDLPAKREFALPRPGR